MENGLNNSKPPETITFPEPDPLLTQKPSLKKYLRYLAFFGPGAVLASMTIGQGQLILAPQLGAWAGYGFLWIILLNLGSYMIAYTSCRFTLISGLSTMSVFSLKTRGSWLNWVFILIIMIFIPMFTAAIITSLGQSMSWIFGFGHYLAWGISFCLLAAVMVLAGRYKILELTQAFFVVVLGLGAIIAVIKIQPDVFEMIPYFFKIGHIPDYPEWMVTNFPDAAAKPVKLLMLGMLGTLSFTIIPLVGYLGWVKVKKWGIFKDQAEPEVFSHRLFQRFKETDKIDYLPDHDLEYKKSKYFTVPLLVDLSIAFLIISLVSICYMTAGKYLLGPQTDGTFKLPSDINLLKEQAIIFKHIGRMLTPLYKISIIFALFGTVYAGFEAVARMLYETSKEMSQRIGSMNYNRFLVYLLIYILSTGVPISVMIWSGFSVMIMLSITLLFIGVIGVIIYGIGIIIIHQRVLPVRYRFGKTGVLLTIIGILAMTFPVLLLFI